MVDLLYSPGTTGKAAKYIHWCACDAVDDKKGADKVADIAEGPVDEAKDSDVKSENGEFSKGDGKEVQD